ncbi:MAG: ComF family protein [Acidobacteriota bacterium]|nr:ComF family protein [Acidobacteriota bacterium]
MAGRFTPSSGGDAAAPAGETPALMCGMCELQRPPYERALAYGPYDGALRELVHLLKYARVHTAAPVLGRMLAEVIVGLEIVGTNGGSEKVLVVPVPLYQSKQKQRGFNQALEVTRTALRFMAPVARGRYELAAERLLRVRDTASQTGLTRHQRRENVRGAFVAADPESLQGATVLVVDDVFTTGTTVTECTKVLRRAGAEKVYVATVARVLKNDAALIEPDVVQAFEDVQAIEDEPTKSRAAHA